MSFYAELKRRNVVRVGIAYAVIGWVLAQIAEFAFENFGAPEWVLKTFVVVLLLGLPLALFFAWAFEITPEGLKREEDVDRSNSITHLTGRKLDFVIIGALIVALGYFVWERQTRGVDEINVAQTATEDAESASIASQESRSIAVLPFVNMSSDKEQEYFADGLTEEILNSLTKTPDLLVTARTSSFSYKGSDKPIPTIAAELGVGHILEGSVRRGDDRLRITAQLIRASDGFHIWSESFDRTMDDVIAVQEEIAVRIANALETTMDPEALERMMSAGTSSVAAFGAYLTGVGVMSSARASGDRHEALKARESFEKAIEFDPKFAQAHWMLAEFWWEQSQSNQLFSDVTDLPREMIEANRDLAIKNAIQFEKDQPTKLKYRTAQAEIELNFQLSASLSAEYMALRPNDEEFFGILLNGYRRLGHHTEVAKVVRDRYEEFELSRASSNAVATALRTVEDAELMRTIAHEAIDKYGSDMSLMYQVHRLLLWAGDIDGASKLVPRILNSDIDQENQLLVELRQACAENRTADAQQVHAKIIKNHADLLSIMWLGYEIIGDTDSSASLFDEYDERRDLDTISSYLTYPNFDPKPYANFMRAVAGQNLEDRVVLELPYRCNR